MRTALGIGLLSGTTVLLAMGALAGTELGDALQRTPDLHHGQELFDTCAACHQANGSGAGKQGIPAIAGQHAEVILSELADFRAARRLDARMEAVASRHELPGPKDLADVAAFVAAMPAIPNTDFGSGQHAAAGRLAYERSCARCHGATAEGNGRQRYPRLAGQHYTYLLNQLDAMIGGYRSNVGWKHEQSINGLSDDEIMGVADYLARLKSEPAR